MTIFYICPWAEKPTGGIKQIFRHVEALDAAGFDAYALVLDSTAPDWFDSPAPVATVHPPKFSWIPRRSAWKKNRMDWVSSPVSPNIKLRLESGKNLQRRLGPIDILVLPEYPGKKLQPCGFGSSLVIFNQNAHYTFAGYSYFDDAGTSIYRDKVLAALAVSTHTFDYLKYAFADLRVLLTPNGVDTERFHPGGEAKKRQIAFMPRKLPKDIVQVLQMLRARGVLQGWELCAIDGMGEAAVAQALRESAIFLSTCHEEGFGLPPLEAGASGCVVVGYTGHAAREFMLPEHCHPVPQGDVLGFARAVERAMAEFDTHPQKARQLGDDFARFARMRYSKEAEGRAVVAAWQQICGASGQRR